MAINYYGTLNVGLPYVHPISPHISHLPAHICMHGRAQADWRPRPGVSEQMCQKFFPLIPAGTGRIVVVSSIACHLDKFGAAIRHEFQRADLRIDELSGMMERFLDAVRRGTSRDEGWARGYSTTKAADTALAAVLARDNPGTLINACCPGWQVTLSLAF